MNSDPTPYEYYLIEVMKRVQRQTRRPVKVIHLEVELGRSDRTIRYWLSKMHRKNMIRPTTRAYRGRAWVIEGWLLSPGEPSINLANSMVDETSG